MLIKKIFKILKILVSGNFMGQHPSIRARRFFVNLTQDRVIWKKDLN